MTKGWRYRVLGAVGTAALAWLVVVLANQSVTQELVALLPVIGKLAVEPARGSELLFEVATTLVVVLVACLPLYKPRPRRLFDVVTLAQKRIVVAVLGLATIGYFDYTYRLPRSTLLVTGGLLFVLVPAWFLLIRRQPDKREERAIVVGDDPTEMAKMIEATDLQVMGYVAPPRVVPQPGLAETMTGATDGGIRLGNLDHLGGLSRLDEVLVGHEIDTVLLGFSQPDRGEFFGALDACHEHGVAAKVHRRHADTVLTTGFGEGQLVDINLEPWDAQDHVLKRGFDVVFALVGLVLLAPVVVAIAAAIGLTDGRPILYRQERTAIRGDTFTVYKFRTMRPVEECSKPIDDETNHRITELGTFLRRTHLDEIPQLLTVLRGDMSVVGPRAAWRDEEDTYLTERSTAWRQRWFVKPGLTGLAQINGASSTDPETKLRYDVEYIRRQSFLFDVQIVGRQLWLVLEDLVAEVAG